MIAVATGSGRGGERTAVPPAGPEKAGRGRRGGGSTASSSRFAAGWCSRCSACCSGGRSSRCSPDVPAIIDMGTDYVTVVTVASCGVFLLFVAERLMQATGNTVYHMVTQLIGALLNCILDPHPDLRPAGLPRTGHHGARRSPPWPRRSSPWRSGLRSTCASTATCTSACAASGRTGASSPRSCASACPPRCSSR